jgi:hypothetical protein
VLQNPETGTWGGGGQHPGDKRVKWWILDTVINNKSQQMENLTSEDIMRRLKNLHMSTSRTKLEKPYTHLYSAFRHCKAIMQLRC